MSDMQFGVFAMVSGMVITFLALYIIGWLVKLMTKLWPYKEEEEKKSGG
jgi:Na+-transporting methylmalonyl-CoA/oxaloacetate decarboxylase gamma subunit